MADVKYLSNYMIDKIQKALRAYDIEVEAGKGAGFQVRYAKYPRFCMVQFDPQKNWFHLKVVAPGGLNMEDAQRCSEEINTGLDVLATMHSISPDLVAHDPSAAKLKAREQEVADGEKERTHKFEVGFFRVLCFSTQCPQPCPLNTFLLLHRAKQSFEYRMGPKNCGSPGWASRTKWIEKRNEENGTWEVLEDTRVSSAAH